MSDRAVLDQAIAALESQRAILGDAVVNASLAAIRAQIAALTTPRPEQQRKLVTILFADVSGFTALSETLDAEDVTTVMNALWERLDAAVLMHGGRIDKHIGDALMALWGADAAREDNPEQAVRAALAMQQALADFRATQGIALAMRIGVNTGPVLLGAVGTTQEFTAMGDAVNLASRLEHAAPVDGVLISYDTLRHVQGLFEAIPQPPLTVKGKVAPVQTYVVMAAKARVFQPMSRGVEGVFTRTIGRLSKLQALQRIYDETTETPVLRMVVVVGEAGVGKSRLLREFEAWLDDHPTAPTLLRGRATLESLHRPGGLLRDLLNAFAGLWETDDLETVRQKLRVVLGPALGPGGAAVLGQAAGFDFHDDPAVQAASSADFTDLATSAIVGLLGALANEAPLAVLLEDLHWADERSLDLLDAALRQLASRPLLVLGLARPTLYERRPGWGSEPAGYLRLNLPPLSGDESAALVDEILRQAPGAPAALRAMVVEQAEGNPFYIEELIKMFLDSNVIARGATLDAPWVFNPDRLTGLTVPPTLTGVLQARLDGLPPEEKLTLQRAAVVGRAFWDEAVAALAAASETAPLIETTLNGLTARELVFRRERSAFAEAEEYSFKHALLREVAYESVLLRQRRQYHALVAGWIERISGARSNEYAALIADHWAQTEETVEEGRWQARAGHWAIAQHANEEALRRLSRALELLPDDATALYLARGRAYETLGEFDHACADYEQGLRLARAAHDGGTTWQSMLDLGQLWASRDYQQTGVWFGRALALAQTLGEPYRLAQSLNRLGNWHVNVGQMAEGLHLHEQALALFEAGHNQQGMADTLDLLGMANGLYGDMHRSVQQFGRAIELYRTLEDHAGLSSALASRAYFSGAVYGGPAIVAQCTPDDCATDLAEAFRLAHQIGWSGGQAYAAYHSSRVYEAFGAYGIALMHGRQALDIATSIDHRQWMAAAHWALGQIFVALLAPDRAIHELHLGLEQARALGSEIHVGEITSSLTMAYLLNHDLANAQEVLVAALPRDQPPRSFVQRRLTLTWGELALAQGAPDEALAIAERLIESAPGEVHAPIPVLLKLKGAALLALGRVEAAAQVLEVARSTAEAQELRPLLWQILGVLGQAQQRLDSPQRAHDTLLSAHTIIDALATTLDDADLRDQFVRGARDSLA